MVLYASLRASSLIWRGQGKDHDAHFCRVSTEASLATAFFLTVKVVLRLVGRPRVGAILDRANKERFTHLNKLK